MPRQRGTIDIGAFRFSLNRERGGERKKENVGKRIPATPEIPIKRSSSGLKISYLIRVIGLESLEPRLR